MDNLQRLRASMEAKGIPALAVTNLDNVSWLTGFTGSNGIALVTTDNAIFLTDTRYTIQAQEEVKNMESDTVSTAGRSMEEFLAEHVNKLGLQRLGFEGDHLTYSTYERWREKLSGVELQGVCGVFDLLRLVKTPDEIQKIRNACKLADACFDHVQRLIQPGVAELDIAIEIDFFFRRQGSKPGFSTIVVSGERSARPHGKPSDKKLEVGDFVTMDFGAKLEGYCSDITRTVVVQEASDRTREVYNQVWKALEASLEMMKPGIKAADVDKRAREVLEEKDMAQYFGHGLGHGLGRVVHDVGRLSSTSKDTLEVGQVWTVEPGVYIPDFGGVRIEDDVVITENGIENMTHATKELLVLPA